MNILVTGANGFLGKNLCTTLQNIKDGKDRSFGEINIGEIYKYDIDSTPQELDNYCENCDFVFNLAGVNRPKTQDEFLAGNCGFLDTLLQLLKKHQNRCPVMLSSSIQALLDNPYGISKKAGEDLLLSYAKEQNSKAYVYRFSNLFGKWSRPNYNSVVATFCNNIASGQDITVNDPFSVVNLCYVDDVVIELIAALKGSPNMAADGLCYVDKVYTVTVGEIADLVKGFKNSRGDLSVPGRQSEFAKKLYATYLSYIPPTQYAYDLDMKCDERGSFSEVLRDLSCGQVSINVAKKGIVKGNHWHHTKNEKFLVVSGKGRINMRKIGESEVYTYDVSGEKLQVVDIPTGYTHNIENVGDTPLVTLMWANEAFNPDKPDTYFEKV